MKTFACLLLFLSFSTSAFADEESFLSWWKKTDTPEEFKEGTKHYSKRIVLKFKDLKKYAANPPQKPNSILGPLEKTFLLYSEKNTTILLVTPKNTLKGKNNAAKTGDEKCANDKSWIVVLPDNTWSEIDLNPYCSASYGKDEIDIALYWVENSNKPYIEVVTNGPPCIPHELYKWDNKTKRYQLKAEKCTA